MDKKKFTFPPAPNWFNGHALTSSGSTLAFAAKQEIVLIKNLEDVKIVRGFDHDRNVKICALTFIDESELIATSDDGLVKRIRIKPGGENANDDDDDDGFIQHEEHRKICKEKKKVNAALAFGDNSKQIGTGDEEGNVLIWDLRVQQEKPKIKQLNFKSGKRNAVTFLACNGHDVLAVGCKFGLVFLVESGVLRQKVRCHDEDVQTISFFGADKFAVSSRDKTFSVWSRESGSQSAKLTLAKSGSDFNKQQSWNCCKFLDENTLITNGSHGEILRWDLTAIPENNDGVKRGDEKSENAVRVLHRQHPKCVTQIEILDGNRIYSVGQDRAFNCFDLSRDELAFNLPCLAGWMYCMSANPVEPNTLALGAGDGLIRIFKASTFRTNSIQQKLNNAKVTSLCWHPKYEDQLAFGTDEGRIGVVNNAIKVNHAVALLPYKHKGSVYRLEFGFYGGDVKLFSCGDNKVTIHAGDKALDMDSEVLNLKKSLKRTDLAFLPDSRRNILALGCDDGTVEIYKDNSSLLITLKTFQKLIQSLNWRHPDNVLAVSSNENDIHAFRLKSALESDQPSMITKPDVTLTGHWSRAVQLSWSPHNPDHLVSVSYDTSAIVWSVAEKRILGRFSGHAGNTRLLSCIWHPSNEDLVMTGGEDCTLRCWRISEQDNSPLKKVKRVKPQGNKVKMVNIKSEESEKRQIKEKFLFPLCLKSEAERKKNGLDSRDVLQLADGTIHDLGDAPTIHMKAFQDRLSAGQMLKSESEHQSNFDLAGHLSLWSGDPGEIVRKAVRNGEVTDWILNLASFAGRRLWLEASEAYAVQLEANDEPVKAASVLMTLHKAEKAVKLLAKCGHFRSAVAIAKARFEPDCPLLDDLYKGWAQKAVGFGEYELAAKCLVTVGQLAEAAALLAKRRDPESLKAASILTSKSGDEDKAKLLAVQAEALTQAVVTNHSNTGVNDDDLVNQGDNVTNQV